MTLLDTSVINFNFEATWSADEQASMAERFASGLCALEEVVGTLPNAKSWTVLKKTAVDEQREIGAVTDISTHTILISPKCPEYTLLHELYHVLHADFDFEANIFEEGIAIAVSTLACERLQIETVFDHSNFICNQAKLRFLPNDPFIPLEQFNDLCPMRYDVLGKFWLTQEKQSPGLLKFLTQRRDGFATMTPPKRMMSLLKAVSEFKTEVATSLAEFWGMRPRLEMLKSINLNETFFTLFFSSKYKNLHLFSWRRRLVIMNEKQWEGPAFIEAGVSRTLKLVFSKINGNEVINDPIFTIGDTGYQAFYVGNIPDLIGPSPDGYLVAAFDEATGELLDELSVTL